MGDVMRRDDVRDKMSDTVIVIVAAAIVLVIVAGFGRVYGLW
jgi:hypothetical protein